MASRERATTEGTDRLRARFGEHAFRQAHGLWLSTIGLGTYLGGYDDDTDSRYEAVIRLALAGGINVVDTAINYRCQRSERVVGRALAGAIEAGEAERDEIVISTKGGFLPFDGQPPPDVAGYVEKTFVQSGLCPAEAIVHDCHSMHPDFLALQLGSSLANLGLEAVDIYFVHNPEQQRQAVGVDEFYQRLEQAFGRLEACVADGQVGLYGVATWDGLRVAPDHGHYIDLTRVLEAAERAGGREHHFGAIQLPYHLAMTEALTVANQRHGDETVSVLDAADRLDLVVLGSVSLLQRQLVVSLPERIARQMRDRPSHAHRALDFARSAPGITTALVGTSCVEHMQENLQLSASSPVGLEAYARLFGPGDE